MEILSKDLRKNHYIMGTDETKDIISTFKDNYHYPEGA